MKVTARRQKKKESTPTTQRFPELALLLLLGMYITIIIENESALLSILAVKKSTAVAVAWTDEVEPV